MLIRTIGLLLLALQTTTSTADDDRIDTLTLVVVVIFIAAMLVLSLLIHRDRTAPAEPTTEHSPADEPRRPLEERATPRLARPESAGRESTPVWLRGVNFAKGDGSLSEAARLIEALLQARQNRDLAAGLALYAPGPREELIARMGGDASELAQVYAERACDDDTPALQSVEIVETAPARMRVRAAYSDRANEVFTLVRLDGCWLIENIASSR